MISSREPGPDFGGSARSPLEKNPVQPASLTQHPSLSTPLGRSTAMRAGRSTMAAQLGTSGQSKVGAPAAGIEDMGVQPGMDRRVSRCGKAGAAVSKAGEGQALCQAEAL